ncbi:MAG: hypothetical protein M1827_004048 [Pycnora praestabilis]|nr:MAG: hypothetical protein M1827_004048 [Pycnora praestabilis]
MASQTSTTTVSSKLTVSKPAAPRTTHFFLLPLEIRLQIYGYLLTPASAQALRLYTPTNLHPAILRVCHAAHNEAIPILYGANTFLVIAGYRLAKCWFDRLAAHAEEIRSVEIRRGLWRGAYKLVPDVEEVAKRCIGLRRLVVNLEMEGYKDEKVGEMGRDGVRVLRVVDEKCLGPIVEKMAEKLEGLKFLEIRGLADEGVCKRAIDMARQRRLR